MGAGEVMEMVEIVEHSVDKLYWVGSKGDSEMLVWTIVKALNMDKTNEQAYCRCCCIPSSSSAPSVPLPF